MARVRIGSSKEKPLSYELNTLTRHAAVLGATGRRGATSTSTQPSSSYPSNI